MTMMMNFQKIQHHIYKKVTFFKIFIEQIKLVILTKIRVGIILAPIRLKTKEDDNIMYNNVKK